MRVDDYSKDRRSPIEHMLHSLWLMNSGRSDMLPLKIVFIAHNYIHHVEKVNSQCMTVITFCHAIYHLSKDFIIFRSLSEAFQ